ncbi:NADH-quinone oxidoreductase subunit A [bacterium (Candidatus Blackallbacteria) CG17_big_fil_post_rev_8_21_14_2_50_48_46]|uniref:NADH-quinone oxidoreductase subunit A n=1 Tax=bacterium (Candidatus Blackallbacteria) CG17_big_fil_post_rev_8_21_14_2_50_48_46 TaxID=2014261 RepID=A0A2M7G1H3_9BACT|nr:MAG: NADH-quinone oxidoreductase subunit A [bacterium (Candidatus Blackallbacteria) CG18_big_fil_WC_8_21_14_2_50_49_26]PIW15573.1 MAG: NADH-quinone oxidoreductase subunit A [bacterium (Candidatus Blackallbacteria) CG17_big_fil_post_rev_8_21_14_2_50_48_46]PIW49364.1 MAG: NADH-quinone oxidoreductase subunit A [bacterium (Candidatus Blackallbacteria) CG13_big_fil_rev_8_21_14_2_50_49_14]
MSENALAMITVLLLAVAVPIAILIISNLLGGGKHGGTPSKFLPYESGISQTVGTADDRVSIKYYLTAIIFIIFDVEAVFLYPWAVNFKLLGIAGLWEMLLFLTVLLAGYVYIWKKGALKWD